MSGSNRFLLVAALMVTEMIVVVAPKFFGMDKLAMFGLEQMASPARHGADYSNTEELGGVLYTTYMYPFEIAAVILLVAIVAAIVLTMRKRPETKYQNPSKQVSVKPSERVRLVSMTSTPTAEAAKTEGMGSS